MMSVGGAPHGVLDSRFLRIVLFPILAVLTLRFFVEFMFLLPSPVGDAAYFLTASANYCQSGFLGTTIYPIDPTGQARMIWHGFVSPMLYSALNLGCGARDYYLTLWVIQALTTAAILLLARRRQLSMLSTVGLAFFALAAQTNIYFRPECLAILLVILAEIAIEREGYFSLGAVLGILLCTQPTAAGLCGISLVILRPYLVKHWIAIAGGGLMAVFVLLLTYPFPAIDLVGGIRLQAQRLIGRTDGGVLSYYLLMPSLPAWSLVLLAACILAARRNPYLIVLLPLLWFFGPRVPPVYYNLVPLCLLFVIVTMTRTSPAAAGVLGTACLIVGVLGLGFVSVRDILTINRYGDTFRATSDQVTRLVANGANFKTVPPFLALTNPAQRFTDPTLKVGKAAATEGSAVNIFAANGMPVSPCPAADSNAQSVSLAIGGLTLFRSNSGWMIYVCPGPSGNTGQG